jgi:uncharacterized protein YigA (DUF484 family)
MQGLFKKIFLLTLLGSTLLATDALFIPGYTMINTQMKSAQQKRTEMSDNFKKLLAIAAKNMTLENEISSILQEIAKSSEFNVEVEAAKAKQIETDIARAKVMNDGYGNINKEIEARWKTK